MQASIRHLALALSLACGAVCAQTAPGEENTACASQSPGGDFVQFTCELPLPKPPQEPSHKPPHKSAKPATQAEQRWRFKADFAGGHDDTSASMTLTLDDAPLACDAGSKTRLFGEDGNVSLVCHFRVPAAPGARPVLGVALLWSHAQYVKTELRAEQPQRLQPPSAATRRTVQ